jgi:hypothetical protein
MFVNKMSNEEFQRLLDELDGNSLETLKTKTLDILPMVMLSTTFVMEAISSVGLQHRLVGAI